MARPKRFLVAFLLALLLPAAADVAGETRFRSFALVVDPGAESLAAWQVELTYDAASVRIVGVEGGREPWQEAPYYDPKGFDAGRMLVASFTLVSNPPAGATRVARVHVQETIGIGTTIRVKLTAAADANGRRIGATVRLVPEKGVRP
jgi:hypothetical protein